MPKFKKTTPWRDPGSSTYLSITELHICRVHTGWHSLGDLDIAHWILPLMVQMSLKTTSRLVPMGLAEPSGQSKGIRGDSFHRDLRFKEVYLRFRSVNSSSRDTMLWCCAPDLIVLKCTLTQLMRLFGSTYKFQTSSAQIFLLQVGFRTFLLFPTLFCLVFLTFGEMYCPIWHYQHLHHSYSQKPNHKKPVTKT